jgi:protein-S-isoprenylcysteine O-methyltransferase Ste14
MSHALLAILLVVTVALLAGALALVRRDYARGTQLSWPTVATVWAAYLVHVAVTIAVAAGAPLGRLGLPEGVSLWLGGFLGGFGVAIVTDALMVFRSFELMSGRDTSRLVTEGTYRYSRNPQNLGWGLALLGVAVAGRSLLALGLVALFAAVIHVYLVRWEEPHLERLFGAEYREYYERTARYFGSPGAPPGGE